MFNHCGQNIKVNETWFLTDVINSEKVRTFEACRLYISECTSEKCGSKLARLVEIRVSDKKEFSETKVGPQAEKLIKRCMTRKKFTDFDIRQAKGTPCGFVHGVNIEVHKPRKEGEKVGKIKQIRHYAADRFGQKELRREIEIV